MSDIMLIDGDMQHTSFDDLAIVVSTDDDIIQSAINNIATIYGENQYHTELGNKILNTRLKLSNTDMIKVADECISAMKQDSRIKSIDNINIIKSTSIYGQCDIAFTITTINNIVLSSSTSINI